MPAIEFWYDFASTYSYLSASRIEDLAARAGATVIWRPFLLGPIFAAQGWTTSPFNLYPAKGRNMWRDMERLAARQGLPFRRPSAMPRNSVLAARAALVADAEGWCAGFTRAVFRANFVEDRDIASPDALGAIVAGLSRNPEPILARAASPEIKDLLRARVDEAIRHGIFGAPTFLVGEELFWGNDRLEQALAWAERPWLPPAAG